MACLNDIGANVQQGEGFGLASELIPTRADEVYAFLCLRILRALRDVVFSTVDDDGMPASRVIDVMAVEPGRLFFLAPRGKSFHGEVMRTGVVAITGQTPDLRMVRLRGRAVHPDDPSEQRRLVDMMFELNPSMNVLYPGDARRVIDAFYIEEGAGEYYDLGQRPLLRVPFALGEPDRMLSRRFEIGERCIGCGRCSDACPAGCIDPATATSATQDDAAKAERALQQSAPYHIQQEHCLRCGLCAEVCPAHAIETQTGRLP